MADADGGIPHRNSNCPPSRARISVDRLPVVGLNLGQGQDVRKCDSTFASTRRRARAAREKLSALKRFGGKEMATFSYTLL